MYEKRDDVADMAGEDYELKVCALLVLRGIKHCPHGFYLASNHDRVGNFDDVVFLWQQEVGAQALQWRGMLLQLKHKQKVALGRMVFLPKPQDQASSRAQGRKTAQSNFSLVEYYRSYREKVRPGWPLTVRGIGDVPLDQVTLGIFTNTGVKKMDFRDVPTAPDFVDTGAVKDGNEVSRITEITFSLTEADVQESFSEYADQDDVKDFLGRFRLFCNQASLDKLKQLIKEELMAALGTSPGDATDGAYTALLESVKKWWAAKNSLAPFLTAGSDVWTDIVEDRMADLGAPLSSAVEALQLTYTPEAAGVFSRVFSQARGQPVMVVCERGCGLLAVGKARQALDAGKGLAVSAEAAERRLQELTAVLRSDACRWLLLLRAGAHCLSADTTHSLLDVLAHKRNATFVLVTEADGVPPDVDERWRRHNDQFSVLQLDDESQKRLLKKTIIFQGMPTTVAEILQGQGAEQLLLGRHVTRLCGGQDPPQVGTTPKDAPPYFVERPLERRCMLRDDIVRSPPASAILALSGLPDFRRRETLEDGARSFSDVIDQTDGSPPTIVLLTKNSGSRQFEQLCSRWGGSGRSVHWLSWKDGAAWRWEGSLGDSSSLRAYLLDGDCSALWPRDALAPVPAERAAVLSAPPGYGKSMLLAQLAVRAKRRLPHALVVVVELGRYSDELPDARSVDAKSVKKLLKSAAKVNDDANEGLDGAIFDFCLDVTGEAVVVLDGFDEISHFDKSFDQLSRGVALLRALLATTRARKVWASSRPATCRPLEEAARSLAFQLRGFSAFEQHQFFTLFLKSIGEDDKIPQVLQQIAALQEGTSLRRQPRSFQEVPLHASMLAEVISSKAGLQILSNGFADLRRLYEIFFDKKADIYQREKRRLALHESHTGHEAATAYDTYQEQIIVFSLRALFAPEEVSELLGGQAGVEEEAAAAALAAVAAHEQTGIVFGVSQGRPRFVHRSFAEYFAALFFSWGFEPRALPAAGLAMLLQRPSPIRQCAADAVRREGPRGVLASALLRDDLDFFTDMLARMLCKDHALHLAALQNDEGEVRRLSQEDASAAARMDLGGRSPLHVAAIYHATAAAKALLPQVSDSCLSIEDQVLRWRALRYADWYEAWGVADALMGFQFSADDLTRTTTTVQTRPRYSEDLLRSFVQNGYCNLIRFLVTECGVSVDTFTDESRQRRALHEAAEARDARLVGVLLDLGADVDARDTGDRTPLQLLCAQAHPEPEQQRAAVAAAEVLLSRGAQVAHTLSRAGAAPLHDAAAKGCAPLLRCLLPEDDESRSEMLLLPNKKGQTALHLAAASNREEALEVLLQLGADPDTPTQLPDLSGATALHVAARHGSVQLVRLLLKAGASPNAMDRDGRTPLYYATGQCVDLLVRAGADLKHKSNDGLTPLLAAVTYDCTHNQLCALVRHGADVTAVDSEGNSAVYLAARRHCSRTVDIITKGNPAAGQEALQRAIERSDASAAVTLLEAGVELGDAARQLRLAAAAGSADIVSAMLDFGHCTAAAAAADAEGRTALHAAAAAGSSEVCEVLLQHGADVCARDAQGRQPLHEAANEATAQALLASGKALVGATDLQGRTPLHAAAADNRLDVARLLVHAGCGLESRDNEGNTALHTAVAADNQKVVRFLLQEGADLSAKNNQGQSPLKLAYCLGGKGRKYEEIFKKVAASRKRLANTKN